EPAERRGAGPPGGGVVVGAGRADRVDGRADALRALERFVEAFGAHGVVAVREEHDDATTRRIAEVFRGARDGLVEGGDAGDFERLDGARERLGGVGERFDLVELRGEAEERGAIAGTNGAR